MRCSRALFTSSAALVLLASAPAHADVEIVVQGGLIQPLVLGGGNAEVDVIVDGFVFGYSHGFLLKLEGSNVVGDAHDQGLAFDLPFSTGFGVGYLVLDWLDVRAEFKWHRFDVRYDDSRGIGGGDLFSYDTFTIGAGVYAHWRPWRDDPGWLAGWNTSASVRFWPRIATTLDDSERDYDNAHLDRRATHEATDIGIANTPLIVNVSVGYAFTILD